MNYAWCLKISNSLRMGRGTMRRMIVRGTGGQRSAERRTKFVGDPGRFCSRGVTGECALSHSEAEDAVHGQAAHVGRHAGARGVAGACGLWLGGKRRGSDGHPNPGRCQCPGHRFSNRRRRRRRRTAATEVDLKLVDIAFDPKDFTIAANTDVVIHLDNVGAAPRNFTVESLGISENLAPGEKKDVTINTGPGDLDYYCVCLTRSGYGRQDYRGRTGCRASMQPVLHLRQKAALRRLWPAGGAKRRQQLNRLRLNCRTSSSCRPTLRCRQIRQRK